MQIWKQYIIWIILSIIHFHVVKADNLVEPTLARQIYEQAKDTAWFVQGNVKTPKHVAYILSEPNCWYCKQYYLQLKPFIDRGELTVRWIMVAVLQPSSLAKTAAILQSPSPAQALNDSYTLSQDEPTSAITAKTKGSIDRNNVFLRRFELGTPFTLYHTGDGDYQVIAGLITASQITQVINSMHNEF